MTNNTKELKLDIQDDLNKILIKLKDVKLINEVNVHYGEYTTDTIPSLTRPDDRDWDDREVNMDKVRLLTLKTAIDDYLNNKENLYEMFDEYKLSNGE